MKTPLLLTPILLASSLVPGSHAAGQTPAGQKQPPAATKPVPAEPDSFERGAKTRGAQTYEQFVAQQPGPATEGPPPASQQTKRLRPDPGLVLNTTTQTVTLNIDPKTEPASYGITDERKEVFQWAKNLLPEGQNMLVLTTQSGTIVQFDITRDNFSHASLTIIETDGTKQKLDVDMEGNSKTNLSEFEQKKMLQKAKNALKQYRGSWKEEGFVQLTTGDIDHTKRALEEEHPARNWRTDPDAQTLFEDRLDKYQKWIFNKAEAILTADNTILTLRNKTDDTTVTFQFFPKNPGTGPVLTLKTPDGKTYKLQALSPTSPGDVVYKDGGTEAEIVERQKVLHTVFQLMVPLEHPSLGSDDEVTVEQSSEQPQQQAVPGKPGKPRPKAHN